MPVRILLLEDSAFDAELISEHLERGPIPCAVERVVTRAEYDAALARGRHDLILSDYALPAFDGMAALEMARERVPDTPFIFISGLFGMNVGGLPFLEDRLGFWIVAAGSLVVAVAVFLFVSRLGRRR